MMRTISLRLDTESDAMLVALCDRLGATQTDVIKKALELLAGEATPSPGALGLELGLIGAYAGGNSRNAELHSAAVKSRLIQRRGSDERPIEGGGVSARVAEPAPRRPKP
jgi:hypothetical protein